jgi:hypothetical protein
MALRIRSVLFSAGVFVFALSCAPLTATARPKGSKQQIVFPPSSLCVPNAKPKCKLGTFVTSPPIVYDRTFYPAVSLGTTPAYLSGGVNDFIFAPGGATDSTGSPVDSTEPDNPLELERLKDNSYCWFLPKHTPFKVVKKVAGMKGVRLFTDTLGAVIVTNLRICRKP